MWTSNSWKPTYQDPHSIEFDKAVNNHQKTSGKLSKQVSESILDYSSQVDNLFEENRVKKAIENLKLISKRLSTFIYKHIDYFTINQREELNKIKEFSVDDYKTNVLLRKEINEETNRLKKLLRELEIIVEEHDKSNSLSHKDWQDIY